MTDVDLDGLEAMSPVPADSPLMVAWEDYKASPDYANTRQWALQEAHVDGSLWAAFGAGFSLARRAPGVSGGEDDVRLLMKARSAIEAGLVTLDGLGAKEGGRVSLMRQTSAEITDRLTALGGRHG